MSREPRTGYGPPDRFSLRGRGLDSAFHDCIDSPGRLGTGLEYSPVATAMWGIPLHPPAALSPVRWPAQSPRLARTSLERTTVAWHTVAIVADAASVGKCRTDAGSVGYDSW